MPCLSLWPVIFILGLYRLAKMERERKRAIAAGKWPWLVVGWLIVLAFAVPAQARWVPRTVWLWQPDRHVASPYPSRRQQRIESCEVDMPNLHPDPRVDAMLIELYCREVTR